MVSVVTGLIQNTIICVTLAGSGGVINDDQRWINTQASLSSVSGSRCAGGPGLARIFYILLKIKKT